MSDVYSIVAVTVAHLKIATQIQTLMGTGYATRIRPEVVPLEEDYALGKPHLVVQRIGTTHVRPLSGETFSFHQSNVQVDVWAKDAQERDNLAQAVRLAMRPNRFRGVRSGLDIRDVSLDLDTDSSSSAVDGSEELDWRTMLRFSIWHRNLTEEV